MMRLIIVAVISFWIGALLARTASDGNRVAADRAGDVLFGVLVLTVGSVLLAAIVQIIRLW